MLSPRGEEAGTLLRAQEAGHGKVRQQPSAGTAERGVPDPCLDGMEVRGVLRDHFERTGVFADLVGLNHFERDYGLLGVASVFLSADLSSAGRRMP